MEAVAYVNRGDGTFARFTPVEGAAYRAYDDWVSLVADNLSGLPQHVSGLITWDPEGRAALKNQSTVNAFANENGLVVQVCKNNIRQYASPKSRHAILKTHPRAMHISSDGSSTLCTLVYADGTKIRRGIEPSLAYLARRQETLQKGEIIFSPWHNIVHSMAVVLAERTPAEDFFAGAHSDDALGSLRRNTRFIFGVPQIVDELYRILTK